PGTKKTSEAPAAEWLLAWRKECRASDGFRHPACVDFGGPALPALAGLDLEVRLVGAAGRHVELLFTERVPLGRDRVHLPTDRGVIGRPALRALADHVAPAGRDADAVLADHRTVDLVVGPEDEPAVLVRVRARPAAGVRVVGRADRLERDDCLVIRLAVERHHPGHGG